MIRPSPAGLRRLLPRLIIGFSPVDGAERVQPGTLRKGALVEARNHELQQKRHGQRQGAGEAGPPELPGITAVSARVRGSGANHSLQARISR